MANLTMVQAINLALIQEMEKDDRVLLLGEDVGNTRSSQRQPTIPVSSFSFNSKLLPRCFGIDSFCVAVVGTTCWRSTQRNAFTP